MVWFVERSGAVARARRLGVAVMTIAMPLAGCATLPSSGPTARQLLTQERGEAAALGVTVTEVSATTVPAPEDAPELSSKSLETLARNARVDLIGPGDVLQIGIFEVGTTLFGSGGVSIAGNAPAGGAAATFDPSARQQLLPGVVVDEAGTIRLPYVGRLKVSGHTTTDIAGMIERGLRGKSQMPQAVVSVGSNITNTVLVSGAVARPGRQVLTLGRERLLDAIAQAGGAAGGPVGNDAPQSTIVRFTRDGRTAEAYLTTISSGSAADLVLIPGDRIDLVRRTRSFTVFGAALRVSQVDFQSLSVSLDEAIARAGGPDDTRADPTAVFVFRYEASDGAGAGTVAGAGAQPRIYRLDLTKPSSYFLAQRFMMHDKDVLYIANARINQTRKLVEIVNLLFSPFFNARAIAR